MRLPNGYGTVVKLGGKRRKPFAVRVTVGFEQKDDKYVQKTKYIGYFSKKPEALNFLAEYNKGAFEPIGGSVKRHTFKEIYDLWQEELDGMNKQVSLSRRRAYDSVIKYFSDIYDKDILSIKTADLQTVFNERKSASSGTVNTMKTVVHKVYSYAMRQEWIDKDLTENLITEYTEKEESIHSPFTNAEIQQLWNNLDKPYVWTVLVMIYTGLRPAEFLALNPQNVDWKNRYVIAGMKTEAGRNRIVPLNRKIIPLLQDNVHGDHFIDMNYAKYRRVFDRMGINHIPHDCRHTCETLMANAGIELHHRKLIMGHAVSDITERVYTHVTPEQLVSDIDRL